MSGKKNIHAPNLYKSYLLITDTRRDIKEPIKLFNFSLSISCLARYNFSQYPRVTLIQPPTHDLTDYFRLGNDLRAWLSVKLSVPLLT